MFTKLLITLPIACAVMLQSCTTLKRYRSAENAKTDNTLADISLFGLKLSEAKPVAGGKSLWDLSADAQSQFLKILNSRYPDNEMFINSMNLEYLGNSDEIVSDDYSKKDLKLIFSVSKNRDYSMIGGSSATGLSPADRIEYLRITLEIPEKTNLRFKGWNMYSTDYGSLNIADVSFGRNLDLGTSASIITGGPASRANAIIEGKSSVSRKEDQLVGYRYLKLNGRINEKKIEMEEEGTREIDLTGNIIADVSVEFDRFPEIITRLSGLKDSTGKFREPENIRIDHSDATVPYMIDYEDTIKAVVKMYYIYRNVGRGRKTFQEWDDRVKYFTGNKEKTFPLFKAGDYLPHFYSIGSDCPRKELLKIRTSGGNTVALKFKTYREAAGFHEWLRNYFSKKEHQENALIIAGETFIFKGGDLTVDHVNGDSCFRVLSYY